MSELCGGTIGSGAMERTPDPDQLVFFLGGRDLEMETIRQLLEAHAPGRVVDAGLGWGARASAYREQILQALGEGRRPVLVELDDDLGRDEPRLVWIDHHGARSGASKPTALEQVFEMLNLPGDGWSRWYELVAANDRAYLSGLAEQGASSEEMREIRAADRRAQGVASDEEAAAAEAAQCLEERCGGQLTVASLPHARTSPLVDRLAPELGGPGFETLVVRSPAEVNVFGPGEVIEHLAAQFPEGWYGGNLPEHGYFGQAGEADAVIETLEAFLDED